MRPNWPPSAFPRRPERAALPGRLPPVPGAPPAARPVCRPIFRPTFGPSVGPSHGSAVPVHQPRRLAVSRATFARGCLTRKGGCRYVPAPCALCDFSYRPSRTQASDWRRRQSNANAPREGATTAEPTTMRQANPGIRAPEPASPHAHFRPPRRRFSRPPRRAPRCITAVLSPFAIPAPAESTQSHRRFQ